MRKVHDLISSNALESYSIELIRLEDTMSYLLDVMNALVDVDTEGQRIDSDTISILMAMHFMAGPSQNNWPEVATLLDKASDRAKYGTAIECYELVYQAYDLLCKKLTEAVSISHDELNKILNKFGLQ